MQAGWLPQAHPLNTEGKLLDSPTKPHLNFAKLWNRPSDEDLNLLFFSSPIDNLTTKGRGGGVPRIEETMTTIGYNKFYTGSL